MEQTQIEPGDRAPAPGPLRAIQLFVNTNDLETGPDLLPDAAALQAWLFEHELLGAGEPVSDDDHARAIALREAIRELVVVPRGAAPRPGGRRGRQRGRRAVPAWCPVLDDPATRFVPTAAGVDGALGHVVAAIHAAIAEDTWERLKACERDICRWAFYDHSKNRSGHWCSMAVCGQREKNRRAYRRRRARAA